MADALQHGYAAASDLFIEMEAAQYTKTGQGACGDDVRFMTVEKENRHLVALSDGLGSGVKANVLATMTTSMAIKFLESNVPMLEAVEIIMDSLPVCEVRKIGYATFSLFDFRLGGKARISEMAPQREREVALAKLNRSVQLRIEILRERIRLIPENLTSALPRGIKYNLIKHAAANPHIIRRAERCSVLRSIGKVVARVIVQTIVKLHKFSICIAIISHQTKVAQVSQLKLLRT